MKASDKVMVWAADRIEASGASFRIPDLANDAVDEFGSDAEFLRDLMSDHLYRVMYEIINHAVRASRRAVPTGNGYVARLDKLVDRATDDDSTASIKSVFATWCERVDEGHKHLLDMNRKDCDAALAHRHAAIEAHRKKYDFIAEIKKGLKGKQTVREAFSNDQLSSIYDEIFTAKDQEEAAA